MGRFTKAAGTRLQGMGTVIEPKRRLRKKLAHRAHDMFFNRVHGSSLVYNMCWEDPRLDRQMLEIKPDSSIVMITSAGCNALDYLLDDPAAIHTVDVNPRQNALLQLKIALLRHGDHEELFSTFGLGVRPGFKNLLGELRGLSPYALRYWEQKHAYFERTPLNPSFFYRSTSGQVAWVVVQSLFNSSPRVRDYVDHLLNARTLDEQRALYKWVEPALWNALNSWLVRQPLTMTMLGVPRSQIRLIESQFPGGLAGFVRSKVERVLTELPIQENYFWRGYAKGGYTRTCCPNYLLPENGPPLRERAGRINIHSTTLANFLRENPGSYSHFVLLDHQDWLAAHDTNALAEEWDLILQNSRPGTRILMRSASVHIDFIPRPVLQRLEQRPDLSEPLHLLDRVGTYGSTLLAEVK